MLVIQVLQASKNWSTLSLLKNKTKNLKGNRFVERTKHEPEKAIMSPQARATSIANAGQCHLPGQFETPKLCELRVHVIDKVLQPVTATSDG